MPKKIVITPENIKIDITDIGQLVQIVVAIVQVMMI
jgi:hypothetical protein